MYVKTQEALRDVSHYIANQLTRGRQKWFASRNIYTTEMDVKPVFVFFCSEHFYSENFLGSIYLRNRMIFLRTLQRCAAQRK